MKFIIKHPNFALMFGDIFISFLSFYAGFSIRFHNYNIFSFEDYNPLLPKAIIFAICIVFISFLIDLYSLERIEGRKEICSKIFLVGCIAFITLASFYYFIPYMKLGRGILFIAVFFSIITLSIWHILYDLFLKKMPGIVKNVLILGTGPVARTLGNLFDSKKINLALAGYVNCVNEPVSVPHKYIIGNGYSLFDIASKERVNKIVISLTERRGTFPVKEVLDCKLKGIDIIDAPSFYEQVSGKLLIENLNPSWFIFSDGFKETIYKRFFKRYLDIFIALIGITISIPFLIIVPFLIKSDSNGYVLLKQERVGEGEKLFTLYKFRTMVDGAENDTGPVWTQENDSRITRIGRFLRKSRLDEIPQLFNVLRGDMSLIGPRPERPFFVKSLKKQIPYYSERLYVKPGITGWAQVRYEYGDSIEDSLEKLRYDLYYIKHLSFFIDFLIVLDTIKVIFFGRGGR
jgi:sugar transferase (PEP-CTERM system associated)